MRAYWPLLLVALWGNLAPAQGPEVHLASGNGVRFLVGWSPEGTVVAVSAVLPEQAATGLATVATQACPGQ